MNWAKFIAVAKIFGPQILALTPLAPIAEEVAEGIALAEQLPGASGAEKLEKAKQIAVLAAKAANDQAGKELVNTAEVEASAGAVISGVVNSVNHIKAIKVDAPVI